MRRDRRGEGYVEEGLRELRKRLRNEGCLTSRIVSAGAGPAGSARVCVTAGVSTTCVVTGLRQRMTRNATKAMIKANNASTKTPMVPVRALVG